ncbi:8-oxo-dGTP pyrophosphatase MutT (NUDIX family) [Microbacterium resistens]|uniref:8-oxo-dGTP pyrophosphatase MutT (NUDIX family) n=1 Tax=Microbacterium resistens TaxID=156977 RepID=A0ABU1SCT1_9MICO|nr:NUDIX domain-containing protein [Microbacterium resistens]MDR6867379.1 8-oxo-dGTP pyrophosphatase MutT (NUDIX family) [Microbacterium resistens]
MTIVPPSPGEPRRPDGPRDPGDAWVVADTGERYWGRFGAAGLLAVDAERGVLLQHRVSWSHFGGTWGLPGGALHQGESALDGALRESTEEAGIPRGAVRPRFASILDLGIWSYTTVVADVVVPFEPVISDPESVALEWVALDRVDELPLHPGFADAWPRLRALLAQRPAIVVDAANVMGSVPDGWWKDRAGAADRLRDRLTAWLHGGVLAEDGSETELTGTELTGAADRAPESDAHEDAREPIQTAPTADIRWYPTVTMVVEGEARSLADIDHGPIIVRRAAGHGDDEIVEAARELQFAGHATTVVTSDRELRARIEALGARTVSAGWLLPRLPR